MLKLSLFINRTQYTICDNKTVKWTYIWIRSSKNFQFNTTVGYAKPFKLKHQTLWCLHVIVWYKSFHTWMISIEWTVWTLQYSSINFYWLITTDISWKAIYRQHKSQHYLLHTSTAISRIYQDYNYKMLSYRRETALQGTLVLAESGRLELRDNILLIL